MIGPNFPIPPEFASKLRYVASKDFRTDAEIIAALNQNVPITSEKNIWTYWHAGIDAMHSWNQRTICDWVRLHGSDWTVRVLNTVPGHPNHALNFIESELLPDALVKDNMTGQWTGPHSADFLRGAALHKYGGAWMDVSCMLFRSMDKICWDQLGDDSTPYTIHSAIQFDNWMANAYIAARKGDPFIKAWHDFFLGLWKGQTEASGIMQSPLMIGSEHINFGAATANGFHWKFDVEFNVVMAYIGQCVAWYRVACTKEPNGGFDGPDYFEKHVLRMNSLNEIWAADKLLHFESDALFKVFTTRLDADPESAEYKQAYEVAWSLLTESSMQKITHGKGLTSDVHCGYLLDENEGTDCEPGTFGELLRYGRVHLEQTREHIDQWDPYKIDPKLIVNKGLLEE